MAQKFGFSRSQPQSPKQAYDLKYNSSRTNILLALILTVVNIGMLIAGGDSYFLFSIFIPYYAVMMGTILTGHYPPDWTPEDYADLPVLDNSFLVVMIVIAVAIMAFYLLSWIFSSKHRVGWLIFALAFFSADTLLMLLLGGFDLTVLVDLAFHIWVVVSLAMGIHAHSKWKSLPDEAPFSMYAYDQTVDAEGMPVTEGDPAATQPMDPSFDTPVLRYADETVKCRILLETEVDGLKITYRRVKRVNELVINGRVYDELEAMVEPSHELNAVVNGHAIAVGFDSSRSRSYAVVDGKQVATKLRWY